MTSERARGGSLAEPALVVAAAPHLRAPVSTSAVMWNVVGSLVPVLAAATWFFGPSALLVTAAAVLGACAPEAASKGLASLRDGSAAITGLLLGLSLPAGMPCWMAFLGGAFGIVCGKLVFGGLGQNVFNPALLGRAFLQAAFPVAITTWPAATERWATLRGDNFALPFTSPLAADVVTSATPLNRMKFDHVETPLLDLVVGSRGGSLGETAAVLILLGGAWLAWRGFLNWRTPAAILGTVAALAAVVHAVEPTRCGDAPSMVLSGGLVLGAVYMATDPVTSPMTGRGCVVFGVLIGVLVVLIRAWGGLPEGVMYSILIANALVPAIDRVTQPRAFGARAARAGP